MSDDKANEPEKKMTFRCPACGDKLSFLGGTVIRLMGRVHAEHFSCSTMFYIPAKLGQYGAIVGEGLQLREGAKVEFECPNGACRKNLTTAYNPDLAEIGMSDEEGREFSVVFGKRYGSRATFLVDIKRRSLVQSYGEHASAFGIDFDKQLNFFGD